MSNSLENSHIPRRHVIRWAIWAAVVGLLAGGWITYKYLSVAG